MLQRMWRKGDLPTLLVGLYVGAATMENIMELPKKKNNKTTNDPTDPLLGI